MGILLGTSQLGSWNVTELLDSLVTELPRDKKCHTLRMYFYAVSVAGWQEVRVAITKWLAVKENRQVIAFVGTDHALTDPNALVQMQRDEIDVRLMRNYRGVFHPKVFWLEGARANLVWVGSNNLTRDGLVNNIEFAALITSAPPAPSGLVKWSAAIEAGSEPLSEDLLTSYKNDRKKFEKKRAATDSTTFTWSKKQEPERLQESRPIEKGDLVVEVMPQETRGGNQVQLPKAAAEQFFGVSGVGSTKTIKLKRVGDTSTRQLVITVFPNNTVRISLNELEYRDRPCVILFRKIRGGIIEFEIVSESIFPTLYRRLLAACGKQTRTGSRRWTIIPKR